LGEKQLLQWFVEFSEYMLTLLGMKYKDAKKEAN